MLYIGEKNGHAYVYHAMWGLHTYKIIGEEGRAVVGKIVITPINFGHQFINASYTPLSAAEGMIILVSPSLLRFNTENNKKLQ
jgi:hypothetical protein